MKRTPVGVLALAVLLMGCKDMGLDDNMPLDEAMERPPKALVAAVMAPAPTADRQLIVDGNMWLPSGLPQNLATEELRAVGSSNGETVYARSWDDPPYDALFTRLEEEAPTDPLRFGPAEGQSYLEFRPVIGGGMPPGTRPSTARENTGH